MYEFFDKHGKKFLAVLGSLLVLVFLLPSNFGRGGGRTAHLGTVDGRNIQPDDVLAARSTLFALQHLHVVSPENPTPTPMPESYFGPGLLRQFTDNGLLWYLLVTEAERSGVSADEQTVESFLTPTNDYVADDGTTVKLKDLNPTIKDNLRADLREALAVGVSFFRARQGAMKISRPLVDDALARQAEQVRAHVAVFDAADFDAKVPAPTADDLKRQFDAYANEPAGVVRDTNPFGFGYQLPARVALQYVAIPDAEVARSIEATKSTELWDEDAIIYYQQHPLEFQTAGSATTQPTTRPFADARADALQKLRAPLVDAKKRLVAGRVVQQMTADLQKTSPATPQPAAKRVATSEATISSGVQLGRIDYLQKLCDAVQKQTGVKPVAVDPGHALTRAELDALPGLGQADPIDPLAPPDPTAPTDVAGYLFTALKPLTDAGTLEPFAPSRVLHGTDGDYIVRVVSAEKAHAPAAMDAVKDQVAKDDRRAKAYGLAQDAAQAAVDKAATAGGLDKTGVAVQTTDWFAADAGTVPGLTGPAAASRLAGPAFDALKGVTSPAALPKTTLAKLRSDGRAVAIEVFAVKTTLDTDTEPRARLQAEGQLVQQTGDSNMLRQWFSLDGVSRRVGYVPDAANKPPEPSTPVPRPTSPFVPG